MGPEVWQVALYLRCKEEELDHVEIGKGPDGLGGTWMGASLDYWYQLRAKLI